MKDIIRVSVVNFKTKWADKKSNLQKILDYVKLAASSGTNIIVFPEMALTGYDEETEEVVDKACKMQVKEAEIIPGESSNAVADLAKKYGIYVVFGMPERDLDDPMKIYNSACICGPEGIIGSYQKIQLAYAENKWGIRGRKPFVFDTEWGPIGVGICFDTYFTPEIIRYYAAKGCRLYLNVTAVAKIHGNYHHKTALEYFAAINNIYIASSNITGIDNTTDFWGGSSIIGPSLRFWESDYYAGYPFTDERGMKPGMITADIDLTLAKRELFEPHEYMNGAVDYRADIYKEMMEDILKDEKYTRKANEKEE